MTGLVEWFLTVLDEREARLREQLADAQRVDLTLQEPKLWGASIPGWYAWPAIEAELRVALAQVEAFRRILDLHCRTHDKVADRLGFAAPDLCYVDAVCYVDAETWPCATVRLLAKPFAHLPGYEEGWRP